jgi:hypothetical protein
MAINPYWKLLTAYSIRHASILMAELDPNSVEETKLSSSVFVIRTALCNAIETRDLQSVTLLRRQPDMDEPSWIDLDETLIHTSELNRFARSAGFPCPIFERGNDPVSTSRNDPFYSAKLNAANRAWLAVTSDPSRLRGKSPKQALEKWLTENALELGLVNSDRTPNRGGIEEVAKVANWKPQGGATPSPQPIAEGYPADIDDEIPW